MSQLLRCVKVTGRLRKGGVYTQLDQYKCVCGRNPAILVSVAEAQGARIVKCVFCNKFAPRGPNGWYSRSYFVPFGDPNFKGADEDTGIYRKKDQKIPSHIGRDTTPIRANKELVR